jgi:ferredoxin
MLLAISNEKEHNMTIWVTYCSPAGTTRQVAEIIAQEAERQGQSVELQDLAGREADAGRIRDNLSHGDVLFVGSPVYAGQSIPNVMEFLSTLPSAPGAFAAPFVTYGGVNGGQALYDMAKIMDSKDLQVLGGIKVLAVHSLLWQSDDPVGKGHPDADDAARIEEFVRLILKKLETEKVEAISLEALDYKGKRTEEPAGQSRLEGFKSNVLPLELDTEACTECGVCADSCPVANIVLSPYPEFGDRCILCFNCVRFCEANAVNSKAIPMFESLVQERKAFFKEPEETRFFV